MPSYKKKSVNVEAVQWDGDAHTANTFIGDRYGIDWEYCASDSTSILLSIMQGSVYGKIGDWLVKYENKVWIVEADVFDMLYEKSEV